VSEQPPEGTVLVFRGPMNDPIVVPTAVATEAERAFRCYGLRVEGMSWAQIATAELYPSASAAMHDVKRYMEEAKALVTEHSQREQLTLEVNRLDALQHAVWANAMTGHVPSAAFAMNVVMNRAKLVGLDPDKMADATARTVVVPVDDDGFLAALKTLAGQGDAAVPTQGESDDQGTTD
jgi:hypothetical protein